MIRAIKSYPFWSQEAFQSARRTRHGFQRFLSQFDREVDGQVKLRLVPEVSSQLAVLVTGFPELFGRLRIVDAFPKIFNVIRDRAGAISPAPFAFQHAVRSELLNSPI